MRIIVGRSGGPERPAASTNTMSRFETEVLTQDGNLEGLGRLNAKWVDGAMSRTPHRRVILDMDSSDFNALSPHWRGPEDDKDGQEAWFTARNASLIG